MPESLVTQLFDFGALGIFAGFLIWQHLGMQKRLDKLIDHFTSQLKEIDGGFEERVEVMRGRYDIVIDNVRKEAREEKEAVIEQRNQLQTQITEIQRDNVRKLDVAIEKLDFGLQQMQQRYKDRE
jgi:hypothetical protein